ncbi:MAG: CBS domain-containing protein [Betaproteobacteria bacterium]|nr:CBS domain-containing protein [Betaproteobacteria bacterium]
MKVRDFCSRIIVVAEPGTDLRTAAQMMRDNHVGALVVVDRKEGARRPLGILTDRDIVVAVVAAPGVRPEALRVGDVMTSELAVVDEYDGVFEAVEMMRDRGARRLPVVAGDGTLVGILTLDDLLRVLAAELEGLTEAVRSSTAREAHQRQALESRPA